LLPIECFIGVDVVDSWGREPSLFLSSFEHDHFFSLVPTNAKSLEEVIRTVRCPLNSIRAVAVEAHSKAIYYDMEMKYGGESGENNKEPIKGVTSAMRVAALAL
jgi:hypothetical protein